ncbi:hypothetical protein RQP46_005095 [Phenoliferia psychrophenolica]
MLATSLLASLAAVSAVTALPSMIVSRDNQPPCTPALSADTYNIFVAGNDSTGWQYQPSTSGAVVLTSIGYDTSATAITWVVGAANNGLQILPNGGSDKSTCLVDQDTGNSNLLSGGGCADSDSTFTIGCQTCSTHFATGCTIASPSALCATTASNGALPLNACDSTPSAPQLWDFMISQ